MAGEILSHPGRLLEQHASGVRSVMEQEVKAVYPLIDCQGLFGLEPDQLDMVVKSIGLLHDLGKATPWFQTKIRGGKLDGAEVELAKHALLGALAVFDLIQQALPEPLDFRLPLLAFEVVRRHHGYGRDLAEDLSLSAPQEKILLTQRQKLGQEYLAWVTEELKPLKFFFQPEEAFVNLNKLRRNFNAKLDPESLQQPDIKAFMLVNYLFSLLTYADRRDVVFREAPLPIRPDLPANAVDCWRQSQGHDQPQSSINQLRNDLYNEVKRRVQEAPLKRIYTIPAPTGLGKTSCLLYAGLELRLRVQHLTGSAPRIIYSLPFLSIIDQNYDIAQNVFSSNDRPVPHNLLSAQHHLVPLEYQDEEVDYEKQKAALLLDSWTSEVTFTTFVSLFESIITNHRNTRFHRLLGSVLLLDEIQAIPRKYWELLAAVFEHLVLYGGCLPVVGTATMPELFPNHLITPLCTSQTGKLQRYTYHAIPKINLEEFIQGPVLEACRQARDNNSKIIVVLNTIKSAEEVFNSIESFNENFNPVFLSSMLPPAVRLKRVQEIKNRQGFTVLVTTQLVEAGVDLDFDLALRDMAPLDSLVQVAGRVNRSWKLQSGHMEIYEINNGRTPFWQYIYSPELVVTTREMLNKFPKGDEPAIYALLDSYFSKIKRSGSPDESLDILRAIDQLQLEKIGTFQLIQEQGPMITVFIELDVSASKAWQRLNDFFKTSAGQADSLAHKDELNALYRGISPYLVNCRLPQHESFSPPPEYHGIFYVGPSEKEYFYNKNTGFHLTGPKNNKLNNVL